MKNLLRVSYYFILFSITFLLVGAQQEDSELFKNVITNSGFKLDLITSNNSKIKPSITVKNQNALIETKFLPNNFFTDSLEGLNYKFIFFVCNSYYEEKGIFRCLNNYVEVLNSTNFKSDSIVLKDTKNNEVVNISIFSNNLSTTTIFVIPSNSFENNFKISLVSSYFSSLNRSSKVSVDNTITTNKNFFQILDEYLKSTSLELLIYSSIFLVTFVFVGKLLVYLKNKHKKIETREVFKLIDYFLFGSFSKNSFSKLLFIFSILIYILLFLQFISPFYGSYAVILKELAFDFLNFNIFREISSRNYTKVIFFTYSYFVIFIIIFSRFEYFIETIASLYTKFKTYSARKDSLKYFFIIINILSNLFLITFNKFYTFEFLLYLIILNLFLGIFLFKEKIDLYSVFSTKEKIIIAFVFLILSLSVFYYQNFIVKQTYTYENLIGISDKIVSLPYKKQAPENALFNNLADYNINYPLFIDEYLIFHPNYGKYYNKNISKFIETDINFVVTSKSYEDLIRLLLDKPDLVKNLPITKGSKLVYVNKSREDISSQLSIHLNLNCSYKSSSTFDINLYYIENNIFKKNKLLLGNVIGCVSENQKYSFKLPIDLSSKDAFFIEFLEKDNRYINSYLIEGENNKFPSLALKEIGINNSFNYYVSSNLLPGSELTNYFLYDKKEISFDNSDITNNLNTLKRDKFIGEVFNIWSLELYRLIVNMYESK